ncbi:MAG: TetR/AcrR family transcriptional regulator [Sneathiella sp.]
MRIKDNNKRRAIRDAAVTEVIVGGLGGASVSKIAKRANVSAGTIYLYFPNKEELLQQVFLEIKTELHEHMMAVFKPTENSAENIKKMWFSLFEYILSNPNDFVFSEYVSAAQLLDDKRKPEVEAMAMEIGGILMSAIEDGTLRRVSLNSLSALLIAPAVQLGKRAIHEELPIDRQTIEDTFDMIWRGVSFS